jgi:phospholipid/cholesterol/gamma-HCH transport system substrate-binding protein
VDGRKTLEQFNQAVRSLENNPQQFLFGKSPQIPEYSGAR